MMHLPPVVAAYNIILLPCSKTRSLLSWRAAVPNLHILSDGDKFCPKDMWANLQTDLQNRFDKVEC